MRACSCNQLTRLVLTFQGPSIIAEGIYMKELKADLSPKALLRRLIRWAGIAFACFALAVVGFYIVENIRGRIAWSRYKRQLEAKGEKLNWAEYVEKPVPD